MLSKAAVLFPGILLLMFPAERIPAQATPQSTAQVTAPSDQPKHPAHATGPKHTAEGVIRGVTCRYPTVIEFRLEGGRRPIAVYNNDFAKIDLSALGFTPSGSMNPCKDFEGRKAQIRYAESADKTVDGEVLAVELKK